jgi:peptide/nickel transport system permease protein
VLTAGWLLLAIVAAALAAPLLAPADPLAQSLEFKLQPPVWQGGSPAHPLGTDSLGRDELSRLLYGARPSVLIALASVVLAAAVGTVLGSIAGYSGGWLDSAIMRVVEFFMALPLLLLAIAMLAFLGPGLLNVVIAVAIRQWVEYCRMVRGEILSLKNREFVQASRASGASSTRIIALHLLPNAMAPVIVVATYSIGLVVLVEATLSFLGLGLPPEVPTWGSMLSEGRGYMHQAWWLSVVPGFAIFLLVLAINVLGDGLRDLWDPRLRHE